MDRGVTVKRIWEDNDIVELECSVNTGVFCGTATCYTAHETLATFADDLRLFAQACEGTATFSAALADGTKAVTIEIRAIDQAKHTVATVKLVTDRGIRPD